MRQGMLAFHVEHASRGVLEYVIHPRCGGFHSNFDGQLPEYRVRICGRCATSRDGAEGACKAIDALLPIILFFSSVRSIDKVRLSFTRNDFCQFDTMPSQRAAFIIMHYALLHSECTFFGASKFISRFFRYSIEDRHFLFPILIHIVLMQSLAGENGRNMDVEDCIRAHIQQTKQKLATLIEHARGLTEKDALVNGLNTIYSMNSLCEHCLGELLGDLRREYLAIRQHC